MIRLQDIADMAGVSRTTVSNVINGNTKRVSQAHGMYSLQDSFVGELVGTIQMEAEMKGYCGYGGSEQDYRIKCNKW